MLGIPAAPFCPSLDAPGEKLIYPWDLGLGVGVTFESSPTLQ